MKKHETVRPMSKGQKKDLAKTVFEAVPEMSFEDADAVLANKGPLVADLRLVFERYIPSSLANRQLEMWRKIYCDHFGIELGPVVIRTHRKGFDRLIVVAKGVTTQKAFEVCEKLFPSWKSTNDNLDEAVSINDRMPTVATYAFWVRDRIEADEELKNMSANDLASKASSTETVLERELHEIVYFLETGKHLDLVNVSLLAGSRSRLGGVPRAHWGDGKFRVIVLLYDPGLAIALLRGRQVVS